MMTCNMYGEIHCGRTITEEEVGNVVGAHASHTMTRLYQCQECAEKQRSITEAAKSAGQTAWRDRRGRTTLRDAANAVGATIIDYSRYESLRAIAPPAVRAKFNSAFPWRCS